jgi:SpoIID/LytB domain protein
VTGKEPTIAVGLVENAESVSIRLKGSYQEQDGRVVPPGVISSPPAGLILKPLNPKEDRFLLKATIGIDFHWQQKEELSFSGSLRLVPQPGGKVTVINDVPLEDYITSVVCSEMRSTSPSDLVKAHAVISRSWLLAQLEPQAPQPTEQIKEGEIIRWYDRQVHTGFDVCADDHCQRYQGTGRIDSPVVAKAVADTRGLVLIHDGKPCDARFSKCCGGVTEDFTTAWGDESVPYLVSVVDGPQEIPEQSAREFITAPPNVYCRCSDKKILEQVLNPYDLETQDFFRWQVTLGAREAGDLVKGKLGVDLGRIVKLEPLERGPSGRIKRLRLTGESGSLVVGKELEIRRALSESHLYSSAFVVDKDGSDFILSGAGWGHGVGLCQIGAAVMAFDRIDYQRILEHYYPDSEVKQIYK